MRIVLGSRGSELARAQTALVLTALRKVWPDLEISVQTIKTSGDRPTVDPPDLRAGWKGLFTREIEHSLSAGEIDVAVHSAKDLPSENDSALRIEAVLPRAAVEDVLISKKRGGLSALPAASTIGTGSVRRQSQLRWKRPDLQLSELRGNVPTRLRKLGENPWEAIILARAGLERLDVFGSGELRIDSHVFFAEILDAETYLPAGGQGVIAMQIRAEDAATRRLVTPISDGKALQCLRAEREFLRLLGADCRTPVGVLATLTGGVMTIRGQIFRNGFPIPQMARVEGPDSNPEQLAAQLLEAIGGE
jgi:hydroxymethylbilane synthase